MITTRRTLIKTVAVINLLVNWLSVDGPSQTPSQVNDPSNPVPEYVKRAAQNRPENPSFTEIRQRAIDGQIWPGERRPPTLSKSDQKRIAAMLRPDPADVEKHKEFLRQENTGIFRLYPDFNCISKRTISVAGDCANQVLGGSTRGFRLGSNYSDLKYNNNKLVGIGFFSHEILVDLGDVPIESLALNSPGLYFLSSFTPANDFHSANRQFAGIVSGMKNGEYFYSRSVEPKLDRTYALRVIAFGNGDNIQKRRFRQRGRVEPLLWSFQSLRSDKRVDVIVVFRVIRLEEDGNITVLSKQLSRKKSPVITFGENETLKNFK